MAEFIGRLMGSLEREMRDIGKRAEANLEEALSVPVGRDFAGGVVQRSLPGEPPRKETGQLQGNIESAVARDATSLVLGVGASRPETPDVPEILEFDLNRPFVTTSMNETRVDCDRRLADTARRQT
jgi:hypothetical protein